MNKHLIEQLASVEHDQWVYWSQQISTQENISPERLARWKTLWVPYDKVPEQVKDNDRKWAKKVLDILENQHSPNISRPKYIHKKIDFDLI